MSRVLLLVLALLCASLSAYAADPAPSGDPPIRKLNGHLADIKGRGLYMWDGDVAGDESSCNSQCRLLWPPLYADDGAVPKGAFTLVKRDDGRYQWALRGRPLYRWTSDKKFGDAGGDGVADKWHLVKVTPSAAKPAAPKPNY
jgi:predicted lipoprotein with Yx(FWY)xxD motif